MPDNKKPSWDDFSEENLLNNPTEEIVEEVEEQEEEQVEEKVVAPKKVVKKIVKPKAEKVEETIDEVDDLDKDKNEPDASKVVEEPVNPTDDDYAIEFLSEVQKLTGNEVEVDYGDIDPVSPQGIALRENAVKELALNGFLEQLEQNFPEVFKALEYANNGGDPAELFKIATARDYGRVIIGESDTALAKEVLKEYYQSKGVKSDARIAKLLEVAEESEQGLVKEAQDALSELQKEQEDQKAQLLKNQEQKAQEQKKKDQIFLASMDEVLDKRQLGSFKIGDKTEAVQFRQFVLSNIRRSDDGGYQLVNKIEPGSLEKLLQYQYFQFKKGDLSKIIQQKAATVNASNLSLRLKSEQVKKKTVEETTRNKPSFKNFEID